MESCRKLLCMAAVCASMTIAASAAEGIGNLSPQGAQAYRNILNKAEESYSTAYVSEEGTLKGMWGGLCLAKLIDFDGDAIPELYYAARPEGGQIFQRMYTYQSGQVVQLAIPESVSNFGTDVSPHTSLYIGENKAYLLDGQELMNGNNVNYFTKSGTNIVSAFVYTEPGVDQSFYTVGGKVVSTDTFKSLHSALTDGMRLIEYSFWSSSDNGVDLSATVTEVKNDLWSLGYKLAYPSSDKISIDGKAVQMPVYKVEKNNYYMLRRLAQALSGTSAQFDVAWDAQKNCILLTSGKPYSPVGGENDPFQLVLEDAAIANAAVYLDEKPLSLTAYNIHNNNFFKLRDLAQALNFGIEWDEGNRAVLINTTQPYDTATTEAVVSQGENALLTTHGGPMRALNTFLSSFSEVNFAEDSSFASGDAAKMIDFAFAHTMLNTPTALRYTESDMSLPADVIAQTVREYFNADIAHQSTSRYTYRDERYYAPAVNMDLPSYCSIGDEMYRKTDDTYSVHFVTFKTPGKNITKLMDEDNIFFIGEARTKSSLQQVYEGTATLGRNTEGAYYLISYARE